MLAAATLAATLSWAPLPPATLERTEVAAAWVGHSIYMRTPRHGLGGVALGNRMFAVEGGTSPGLTVSTAIELLDVPSR